MNKLNHPHPPTIKIMPKVSKKKKLVVNLNLNDKLPKLPTMPITIQLSSAEEGVRRSLLVSKSVTIGLGKTGKVLSRKKMKDSVSSKKTDGSSDQGKKKKKKNVKSGITLLDEKIIKLWNIKFKQNLLQVLDPNSTPSQSQSQDISASDSLLEKEDQNQQPDENDNTVIESFNALQSKKENQNTKKRQEIPILGIRSPNLMDLNLYLARIQDYINSLGYNRVGEPKISVNTHASLKTLMDTVKNLIKAGQHIKCLHALIMGIHFTNCTQLIERFPINFKSEFKGREYKHVVLGVYLYGHFGTIGISRDPSLQDKPPAYPRLTDLINEYVRCYTESGHHLIEARIGGIISHDIHSLEQIPWKMATINFTKLLQNEIESTTERVSKMLRSKMNSSCLRQIRPNHLVFPSELIPTHQKRLQNMTNSATPLTRSNATKSSAGGLRNTFKKSNRRSF